MEKGREMQIQFFLKIIYKIREELHSGLKRIKPFAEGFTNRQCARLKSIHMAKLNKNPQKRKHI